LISNQLLTQQLTKDTTNAANHSFPASSSMASIRRNKMPIGLSF
jgi:hypothetical protein